MRNLRRFVLVDENGRLKLDTPIASYGQGWRDLLQIAACPVAVAHLGAGEATAIGFQRTGDSLRKSMKAYRERESA